MKFYWITMAIAIFVFMFCVASMDSANNIPFIIGMIASGAYFLFVGKRTDWLGTVR